MQTAAAIMVTEGNDDATGGGRAGGTPGEDRRYELQNILTQNIPFTCELPGVPGYHFNLTEVFTGDCLRT